VPRPEAMSTQGVQAPSPSPLKLLLGHRAAPKPPPEHAPVLPLPQVVQFASTNDAGRLYGADTGHARQLLAAATDALYRPAGHGMHGHAAVWARPVGLNRPRGHSVETRMDNRRPSSEPTPTSDIIRRAMAAYDNAHKKTRGTPSETHASSANSIRHHHHTPPHEEEQSERART
jgi:hypothetical protein